MSIRKKKKKISIESWDEKLKSGKLWDIDGAAEHTGFSKQHLRRLCHQKKINHIRRGQAFFFAPADVQALIERVAAR